MRSDMVLRAAEIFSRWLGLVFFYQRGIDHCIQLIGETGGMIVVQHQNIVLTPSFPSVASMAS